MSGGGLSQFEAAAPREQGALVAASKRVTLKDPHRASGVEALRDAGAAASSIERAAAHAYAEYCFSVYATDRTWQQWNSLPAFVRRGWIAAIAVAIEVSNEPATPTPGQTPGGGDR